MKKLNTLIWKLRIMRDTRGQDLIEYALMAGFVAVPPVPSSPVRPNYQTIFTKVNTVMSSAAVQG